MFHGELIRKPLEIDRIVRELTSTATSKGGGALVMFLGFVKGVVDDVEVKELVYEAHEIYASKKLKEIAESYKNTKGVIDVIIYHRVGSLKPGEPTIYILVTATNRRIAFNVASEILERVKHEVPIFKLERRGNGEYWIISNGKRVRRESSK